MLLSEILESKIDSSWRELGFVQNTTMILCGNFSLRKQKSFWYPLAGLGPITQTPCWYRRLMGRAQTTQIGCTQLDSLEFNSVPIHLGGVKGSEKGTGTSL